MNGEVWLVGAGGMALDYYTVLGALKKNVIVIGRGIESSKLFEEKVNHEVVSGGLDNFLDTNPTLCDYAIISVGVENLCHSTLSLLKYGVKNILVEKPGAMNKREFKEIVDLANEMAANVMVAYNRRFYASTLKAKDMIEKDGGVTSFNFEFTEWAHVIEPLEKAMGVKEKWFLGNSTHVVDMAFYLGGKPEEISTYSNGNIDWHPSASNFSGAGVSDKDALFNYQANWESAGRWSVEVLTKEHRFIFRPMEKLQIQKRGSVVQEYDEAIDYSLDEKFKPGLYIQTEKFLNSEFDNMCTIEEQYNMIDIYNKIANYGED